MPYSKSLAARIRDVLGGRRGLEEKKMFGGVGFLLHAKMVVGVWNDDLIVRVGPDDYAAALEEPFVREFDVTGRPMRGWVVVVADGLESDRQLQRWIEQAAEFVESLP